MSEPIKCKCPHCGVNVEYGMDEAGQVYECSDCHKPFELVKPVGELIRTKASRKFVPSRILAAGICCIGFGLLFFGFASSAGAVQSLYAEMEICTGWIVIAIAAVVSALTAIARNQAED